MTPTPHDPWPLHRLVLRTPRLELRPDDDDGLRELAEVALNGVHARERMPFSVPWTDTDPAHLGRTVLQYHWGQRAQLAPESWAIHFLVRYEGRVIGTQGLSGKDLRIVGEVETGSWIGLRHHGRGFGTEMRTAVLAFAFDHLGAVRARSAAFVDNPPSRRISARLGYRPDGSAVVVRRGEAAEQLRFVLTAADFARPAWTLQVDGLAACRPLLGL